MILDSVCFEPHVARSRINDINKQQMDTVPVHIIPGMAWRIFWEESPASDSSSTVLYWQYL
jgi:hypothetical protein